MYVYIYTHTHTHTHMCTWAPKAVAHNSPRTTLIMLHKHYTRALTKDTTQVPQSTGFPHNTTPGEKESDAFF